MSHITHPNMYTEELVTADLRVCKVLRIPMRNRHQAYTTETKLVKTKRPIGM